jgi:hypothetical protein
MSGKIREKNRELLKIHWKKFQKKQMLKWNLRGFLI